MVGFHVSQRIGYGGNLRIGFFWGGCIIFFLFCWLCPSPKKTVHPKCFQCNLKILCVVPSDPLHVKLPSVPPKWGLTSCSPCSRPGAHLALLPKVQGRILLKFPAKPTCTLDSWRSCQSCLKLKTFPSNFVDISGRKVCGCHFSVCRSCCVFYVWISMF